MASLSESVTNLVGLLSVAAPQKLEHLKKEFPGSERLLFGGTTMEHQPAITQPIQTDRVIALRVAIDGLRIVAPVLEPAMNKVRFRLIVAHRIEFGGELLGALGSGTAIATVWGKGGAEGGSTATIVAAAIGLVGTLAALAVRFIRRDVLGAENAAAKQYSELRGAAWESRTLLARLEPLKDHPALMNAEADFLKLVQRANDLALHV